MKLHTKLNNHQVIDALADVKSRGLMTNDVFMAQFAYENSLSHRNGFLIRLGTFDKTTGPKKSRHRADNTNLDLGDTVYAATYDEWGWFIAEIFECDPDAKFGPYKNYADFHKKTKDRFK